ncbi:MAG: hypothetical protein O6940_14150 [Ignavibacteria bacterium]|nr:hypothetical protein [Ignavibacteria bacterium]
MAKFQISYNKGKGRRGKTEIFDLEPDQKDSNDFSRCVLENLYIALEKRGFNDLEIFNDLALRIQNLENRKDYYIKDDGSGLSLQRR